MSTARRDDRGRLPAHLRFALVAAATTFVALWSWRGFTLLPADYLASLALVAVVVAVTGAVARWRRLPAVLVVAGQLLLGGAAVCQVVADRPYPGDRFWSALSASVDAANQYAAPVPQNETVSVQPLLVAGGFLAIVVVDLLAATLRRAPLVGLPLLTVYSVPISLIDRGLSWWVFAATAVGYLLLLFLQEQEHLSRWGRSLDGNDATVRRLSDSVRSSALVVGTTATVAAVLLPLAVPTFSFSVFEVGAGGSGGDGDIEVTNPLVDLREDLVRGADVDLLTIRTDDPRPDHLRISVLNRFTDNEWSGGDRTVPGSNVAQGAVPLIDVDPRIVGFEERDYEVEVEDAFRSRWLPTQAPITEIVADGDWRFDETTMDFIASDDDLDTAGLDYDMTAAVPRYPDEAALLSLVTGPSAAPEELTELPDDLPPIIERTARDVTDVATTDFEAAVLLNQFFRDSGEFTYDLPDDPADEVGTGDLADFLDPEAEGGRTGYCEQFAAAMGVMARQLGIPARVAVGFLTPDEVQPGVWVYSAHDLHAWVELYFPRAGWVLFDPTPSDGVRADAQPAYAGAQVEEEAEPTSSASAPTFEPRPTNRPEPVAPSETPQTADAAADQGAGGSSFPWVALLGVLGVVTLLVLLALLPRTLRRRQRERRLAGGPESAWEELRATAVDLRLAWPEGRSPRETRDQVAGWFGRPGDDDQRPAHGAHLAPDAVAALGRVADHVERLRYARHHAVPAGSLRDDVLRCVEALEAGAGPRLRRRATWLPVSAFQRRRVPDLDTPAEVEPEPVGSRSEVL